MASEKFLKTQVGKQSAFGTDVAPTVQVPVVVDYEPGDEIHVAELDSGTWVPADVMTTVGTYATVSMSGTAFFEMLPVLLNSGISDVDPSSTYIHTYAIVPTAPPATAPLPLTMLTGAVSENLGITGPAVKLIDQYLESLTLSGNINDKAISLEAELFGTGYDDNAGAGWAFATPIGGLTTPEVMNALRGGLQIQDALTTGGDFATMTAFACAVIDWELAINTGLKPKYCLTDNVVSFVGVKYDPPEITFDATIRTTSVNYALVKAKHDARTYQELMLTINGTTAAHSAIFKMTGWWAECSSPHNRENGEVVMKAQFKVATCPTQVTTPHLFGAVVTSTQNWT